MYGVLQRSIERALGRLDAIPSDRRSLLDEVASYVSSRRAERHDAFLTFICTHNSRRSQMGQLWATAAAHYFRVDGVQAFSGGTEVTAFNVRAVAAMLRAGFTIDAMGDETSNPRYRVGVFDDGPRLDCFSKIYDDPSNPSEGFAALMTCGEADEACPVVVGASARIPLRYVDPKSADDTPEEAAAYDERSNQIATEMLYIFSRVS